MSRNATPRQADFDAARADEEARIIHKAGSRTQKHKAVLAGTSMARFQYHPDDMEQIIAIRGARANGRVSPTDMFLKNKAVNSKRKACQDRERSRRAAGASSASGYGKDEDDDEMKVPATVRQKAPATARKVAFIVPSSDDDDDDEEEEEETSSTRRHKSKARDHGGINGLFRKLKLNVGNERKTEKKKHGRQA